MGERLEGKGRGGRVLWAPGACPEDLVPLRRQGHEQKFGNWGLTCQWALSAVVVFMSVDPQDWTALLNFAVTLQDRLSTEQALIRVICPETAGNCQRLVLRHHLLAPPFFFFFSFSPTFVPAVRASQPSFTP